MTYLPIYTKSKYDILVGKYCVLPENVAECLPVSAMPQHMEDLAYIQIQLYWLSSLHLIGYDLLMFP